MSRPSPGLTLPEVADQLGVHYMTAYRYVRTGRLAASKVGGEWSVDPDDLRSFSERPAPNPGRAGGAIRRSSVARLEALLLAGDRVGAWVMVEAELAGGASSSSVEVGLLATALRSIGDRWESGELTVGDEHRATVVATHLLSVLASRFTRRGRRRGVVVIGAAPGEEHRIPVTIAADHLRAAGFEVVDFGANTPADAFAAAAAQIAPVAVLVGATARGRDTAVRRVVREVRAAAPTTPVLVGGAAIPGGDEARRLGADGWTGPEAPDVVAAVERLLEAPGPATTARAR